ncbi:MAG: hypothetical protein UX93_C0009G0008 [Microgenomates group bacterium GW2011_GWC1_47_20]|uniref:Antitoxin n=1 Tax=Candidatus Amesbacteria bacterium GW2011_GWC2_45_19 TaxID=1618366 RepID=A0A0G1M3U2_9BACT|nr:MAG: hypothetical protein UX05_C0006G0052 [Candidatus Amesbacteria bacterium GW2011_GWC2_45_19]KKU68234.1 MAG: hypothetical protein UX93_C0009G0008 [Microgenomates group bacterium GW2011_GWC1_47_20]
MATVSDLQRGYRVLVDRIKKTGEPLIVVNNGEPDVVVMDAATYNSGVERIREMEEKYLLKIGEEALEEYRLSKTIRLKKGQKLSDLL